MEGKLRRVDELTQSPLRPESDRVPAEEWDDETVNQQKPDAILEESGDVDQDDKKGKAVLSSVEKGKGKMAVDEEDGSDVDGSERYSDCSSDNGCVDEPLTHINVNNIIPGPRIVVKNEDVSSEEYESDEDDYTTDGEGEEDDEDDEDEEDEEDEGNEEDLENSEEKK